MFGEYKRLMPLPDWSVARLRRHLVDVWNEVAITDMAGVPGDLVRWYEIKVTELLQSGTSSDVYEANRLTARFLYILDSSR